MSSLSAQLRSMRLIAAVAVLLYTQDPSVAGSRSRSAGSQHQRPDHALSSGPLVALQARANSSLSEQFLRGLGALVSDSEMGVDAGLTSEAAALSGKGPATLKDYCQGSHTVIEKDQRVKADWHNMGKMTPGRVVEVNDDTSVDVQFDDGFVQHNIRLGELEIIEDEHPDEMTVKNDPACQLLDFVEKAKKGIDAMHHKLASWLAGKRTEAARAPDAGLLPASNDRAASTEAQDADNVEEMRVELGSDSSQAAYLRTLRTRLAEKDVEIRQLEGEVKANDVEINRAKAQESEEQQSLTIDGLIESYKQKIAQRDERILVLKARLEAQEHEKVSLGVEHVPLKDIAEMMDELTKDMDVARSKRQRLAEVGKLDTELEHSLDHVFEEETKLRTQIEEFIALQEKAKAMRKDGEKVERQEAEDLERHQPADLVGTNARLEEARVLDARLLQKAEEVEQNLRDVQRSTAELDTGVHPHGEKWWRYRYEHSYVEATLMVLISTLMMLWHRVYFNLRQKVGMDGLLSGGSDEAISESNNLYSTWLQQLAKEMMVCLLVFLSVWTLSKLDFFEVVPFLMKENERLHLPRTGAEYLRLSLHLCVVLFVALLFYYSLMLSVVRSSTMKLYHWAQLESAMMMNDPQLHGDRLDDTFGRDPRTSGAGRSDDPRSRPAAKDISDYEKLKHLFMLKVNNDPKYREVIVASGEDVFKSDRFPFWIYLRLCVNGTVDRIFRFSTQLWIGIIISFVVLMGLHRFLHVGNVRIMILAAAMLFLVVVAMVWMIKISAGRAKSFETPPEAAAPRGPSSDKCSWAKELEVDMLQYFVFFLCYGVARMICQPWMWEFHFWPVLFFTVLAILLAIAFGIFVSPLIPTFAATMGMPPYAKPEDLERAMQADVKDLEDYLASSQKTPRASTQKS